MTWQPTHRNDPDGRELADRHYSRQTPGAPGYTPPGCVMVLKAQQVNFAAVWATSWPFAPFVHRQWAGAWVCSLFRLEAHPPFIGPKASNLITQAVAATRWYYANMPNWSCDPMPTEGMITMIDTRQVRSTTVHGESVWGWTYRKAGFVEAGYTKGGLLVLQLWPYDMPAPQRPRLTALQENT